LGQAEATVVISLTVALTEATPPLAAIQRLAPDGARLNRLSI
jgi:hypothetical protein